MDDEKLFTDSAPDRRTFIAQMARRAGGALAAQALLASNPVAATLIAEDDKRFHARMVHWKGAGNRQLFGYMAIPRTGPRKPAAVLVLHDARGLQPDGRDLARRFALAGFIGLAIDFLAPSGGTPADEDAAYRKIGALDLAAATADGVATIRWLAGHRLLNGKIGVVGFGWGGTMANRLAVEAGPALAAAVAYDGATPPSPDAARVQSAIMLHQSGSDDRTGAEVAAWVSALKVARADVRRFDYPGARLDAEAMALSWERTIALFRETLV